MAQRVFLVQVPVRDLTQACTAIRGSAEDRRAFANRLACEARGHMLRVAASERVAHAAERGGVKLPESWGLARNCMPYLIGATSAAEATASLAHLSNLGNDVATLEEAFVAEARKLSVEPGRPNRGKYAAPKERRVTEWVLSLLNQAAELRSRALKQSSSPAARVAVGDNDDDEPNPIADCAISTWIWLGRIFGRLRPCFWQGRDRWLGNVAFPEEWEVATNLVTIGGDGQGELDSGLREIVAESQARTRRELASTHIAELRDILVSVSELAPDLSVDGSEAEFLPAHGDANLVSGGVRVEHLALLRDAMGGAGKAGVLPYTTTGEWVELVVAAANVAESAQAHLLEGDDVLYGAYRWPAIDDNG